MVFKGLTPFREYLETDTLHNDIVRKRRHYFMYKVKKPLIKVLVFLANKYPEPTRENTRKLNTHALMDIWDEFFGYENNAGRDPLFRAIRKVTIGEYESTSYYAERIDWFLKKLVEKYLKGEWKPLQLWNPTGCWTEPSVVEAQKVRIRELMAEIGITEVKTQ